MKVVQGRVAWHAGVANPAVEAGMNLQRAGPVVRGDYDLQSGEMRITQMDEPAAVHRGFSPLAVLKLIRTMQDPGLQVQGLLVREQVNGLDVEPLVAGMAKGEDQPIRQVHKIFILDRPAFDLGLQPVVSAGQVSPRVVRGIGVRFGSRPAGGEVAVAQRTEGFAQSFLRGIESVVDQ